MKLGKKLLSLLTVFCLTLSLLPTMALAAEGDTVSVGGISLNKGDYLANGAETTTSTAPTGATGYIHFTSDGTLELNNYTDESYTTTHQICGNSGEDLIIKLIGDNYITSSGNGIRSYGKLTISGPGKLTLTNASNGTTIHAIDTITIKDGANIIAPGGYSGQSIHLEAENKEIIITGSNTVVNAINSIYSTGIVRCGNKYNGDDNKGIIRVNDGATLNATKIEGTLQINGKAANLTDNKAEASVTYTMSGTVTYASTPVADATVQLCTTGTADTSTVIATSTTDSNGKYSFTNVSEGNYTIKASKNGYDVWSEDIQINGNITSKDITLTQSTTYNVWVGGIQVTSANKDDVLGDGTVTYTPATTTEAQKLTLNGVNITNTTANTTSGIKASVDLTIVLSGTNNISGTGHAIEMTNGTLTITGPGSLNASSNSGQTTIYAKGNVEINGGAQITVKNTNSDVGDAIHLSGTTNKNLTITGNNTQVIAQKSGSATAINGVATLTVNAGATLLAQSNGTAISCTTFSTDPNSSVKVSNNYDGTSSVEYDRNGNNLSSYKYVQIQSDTTPVVGYNVWVGEIEVTNKNKDNVLGDSTNSVSYEPTTKTLILNGAGIVGALNRQYTSTIKDACGIYSKHDLNIQLSGTNVVSGSTETQDNGNYGIFVEGRLNFTSDSDGSITVSGGESSNNGNAWVPGVYATGGITVKNCNVTAMGGTAENDRYPVAYAMSKAPTLVGAKVVKVNTATSEPETTAETYNPSRINRYQYLQIQKDESAASVVAAPVIAPEGGYFTGSATVTITCPTDGATIYYTTDKNSARTEYTAPISLNEDTTVTAIAVKGNQESATTATFINRTGDAVTAVTLNLNEHAQTLKVGNTSRLTAVVKHEETPIDGLRVTWTSDNEEVATVENGTITAQSVGKARITAFVVENGVTYSDFCDVIVEARPSSSHSSSSTTYYDVNTAVSGEGGSVAAGTKRAARGTTVTVTATAASGYQVAQVSAVDKDGKAVSLTDKGNGVYTFVMPASKVDVTARFAQVQQPEEKDPYSDVSKDSYYYDAVKWAAETGVTTGVGDGLFAPEWVCTRGQIVTFLWRASGSPAPKATEMPFTDVAADAYYAQAVLWAVENGITNGTSETTFSPDQTCTRAHAVAFLYRMSGSPAAAGSTFTDVSADAYYSAAVAWAVEKGITNGTSGTTFSPDDTCTRGQIVTFLYRLAQTK